MELFRENQIKRPFVQESDLQLQISDQQENRDVLRRLLSPELLEVEKNGKKP